jgi:hypothetical protein
MHAELASGQFAGCLIYSSWQGHPYVKRWAKPRQPNTPAWRGVKMEPEILALIRPALDTRPKPIVAITTLAELTERRQEIAASRRRIRHALEVGHTISTTAGTPPKS